MSGLQDIRAQRHALHDRAFDQFCPLDAHPDGRRGCGPLGTARCLPLMHAGRLRISSKTLSTATQSIYAQRSSSAGLEGMRVLTAARPATTFCGFRTIPADVFAYAAFIFKLRYSLVASICFREQFLVL